MRLVLFVLRPKSSIDCAVTLTGLEIDIFWSLGMLFRKLFPKVFLILRYVPLGKFPRYIF